MKKLFTVPDLAMSGSVGMLMLRLVAGAGMILHGWPKIQNPTGWMGPEAEMPGFLLALAAIAEFGGGIAWILGLLVPLASLGMFFTMAVAVHKHAIVAGDPFVGKGGPSWELAAFYLMISVVFMTVGAGRLSLDWFLFKKRE